MTEPVNGVQTGAIQSFQEWKKANPDGTRAEYRLFKKGQKDVDAPVRGAEIERGEAPQATPEELAARKGAQDRQLAEIQNYKEQAPLYQNRHAQRELRQEKRDSYGQFMERIADTIDDPEDKDKFLNRADRLSRRLSRDVVRNEVAQDRVEHSTVFATGKEKRTARRAAGDEAEYFRYRTAPGQITRDKNEVMPIAMQENDGNLDAAIKARIEGVIGEDDRLDIGQETEGAAGALGTNKHSARRTARRAGYDVEPKVKITDVLKSLGIGAGAGLASSSIPVLVEFLSHVHVEAENFTGTIDSVKEAEVKVYPWKSGAAGAAAATLLGYLATANGTGSNEKNLLNGINPEAAIKNPEMIKDKNVRTMIEYIAKEFGEEDGAKMIQSAATGDLGIPTLSQRELAALFDKMVPPEEQAEVQPPVVDEPPAPPVDETPVVDEPPAPPADETPVVDEPPATPVDEQPDPPKPDPAKVLVNNGDTMKKIAERFGVSVEELIELNKDVLGLNSGHIDCEKLQHRYLVAGKQITLPENADATKVKEYNDVYTADKIKADYVKYVTGDKFLEKNRDCYKNIKAAGPESEAAFKKKIMKEAQAAGMEFEAPKNADEVRKLRDHIKQLKQVVENQKKYLKDTFGVDYEPGDKTLQQQTTEMYELIKEHEADAETKKAIAERQGKANIPGFISELDGSSNQRFPFRTIQ